MSNMLNILNLNIDCLFEIFSNLNLQDQINLALSCKRFEDVFLEYGKIYHKIDPHAGNLSVDEYGTFIRLVGQYIEECNENEIVDHLINHGVDNSNLRRVKIWYNHGSSLCIDNLKKFRKLEDIEIDIRNRREYNFNALLDTLEELPNLRKLKLFADFNVWTHKIYNFSTLEQISFSLPHMEYETIIDICKSLPKLRYFRLDYPPLGTLMLQTILDHCQNVELISCNFHKDINQALLADIKKLKFLIVRSVSQLHKKLFINLGASARMLKGLAIFTNSLADDLKLNIINKLQQLRYLHLILNSIEIPVEPPILLPNLEYLYISTDENLGNFILQILEHNHNIRIVHLKYRGIKLEEEFVHKLEICLHRQALEYDRTNFPIWFLCPHYENITDFSKPNSYVRFCTKLPNECESALIQAHREYSEIQNFYMN